MANSEGNITFKSFQKGDKKAYEAFFRSTYDQMVRYAYRIIRDQEESEEIVQKIYISLWEKRADLDIKGDLQNYLIRAIKNRCINYIKLELPKKHRLDDIDDYSEELSSDLDEHLEESKIKSEKIKKAIDELPPKCKEVFVLSRFAGLTYEEIADELDISIKTVENQIGIALKKLRVSLKQYLKK